MIILDTNVVSELMRQEPDKRMHAWLNGLPRQDVGLTAISIFELRFGIEIQAKGRRRNQLERSLLQIFDTGFRGRILDFDERAASAAASISAKLRLAGRSHEIRDTFIAGIVISQNGDLATRHVRHFIGLGLKVIDPWTS